MAPYSDAITAAIDEARATYAEDRDEAKLRRALLELLAELANSPASTGADNSRCTPCWVRESSRHGQAVNA